MELAERLLIIVVVTPFGFRLYPLGALAGLLVRQTLPVGQ